MISPEFVFEENGMMEVCRLCLENLPKKNRRYIFSDTFQVHKQLSEVDNNIKKGDGLSEYVCYKCFNKLNKLQKIDFELENKILNLQQERKDLIDLLSKNVKKTMSSVPITGGASGSSASVKTGDIFCTPRKMGKRLIQHTPTPRKLKKSLIPTPRKSISTTQTSTQPAARKRLAQDALSPRKIKISFRGGGGDKRIRTRIIQESGVYHGLLVGVVRGEKPLVIAKKVMKIKECKENIINCILKIVSAECFSMCSTKNPSLYRQVNADSLATLNFVDLKKELNERAPLLVNILSAMTKTTEEVPLVTSAAVILKWRNIHMSRIHHVVGQLLDQGGATDETIQLVSTLGFSVGSSAVYKKQEDLVSRQEDKRKTEICGQVEQKILQFKCDKTKEMISVLKGTDVTNSQSYYREMQTEFATGNKSYFETKFCAKSYSPYSMCAATEPPMSDSKRQQLTANVFIPALTISGGRKESILFPEVKINSGLELEPFRSTTMSNSSKTLLNGKSFIDRHKENLSNDNLQPPFEIIGDNIDLMKSPSAMTKDKQRQSLHWFLLIGLQKRVISDLPDIEPKNDISILPNSTFLPSKEETTLFENHMIFHISKVLTKHIECLQPYASSVPKYISHPFIEESSKPSTYHILDLLDKSENKSDEMISILETVHEKYIAHSDDDPACVIEKKVFGGDVLTNERAYSAQLAMMNGPSDFCRLGGVIHRPEGLHRMMNFLLVFQHAQLFCFNNFS